MANLVESPWQLVGSVKKLGEESLVCPMVSFLRRNMDKSRKFQMSHIFSPHFQMSHILDLEQARIHHKMMQ